MQQRISDLIVKNGASYKVIGDHVGVSAPTIGNWVAKKRIPRADEAVRLAEFLGVEVQFLLTGEVGHCMSHGGYKLLSMTNREANILLQDMDIIKLKKEAMFRNLSERIAKIAVVCHREHTYAVEG